MINAWVPPDILKKSLASVTALVDEAEMRFEPGGMRINTVDSANVGAVSLELLDTAFHSYEAEGETLILDLGRVEQIIKKTTADGNFIIKYDGDIESLELSTGGYEFRLALLTPDSVRTGPDPREIETSGLVEMDADEFEEAVRIGSMFSEQIRVGIDENKNIFYMKSQGDYDDMIVELGPGEVEKMDVAKAYGNYNLSYLRDICSAIPAGQTIKIGIGEELPLQIQYKIADGDGRITYGLAPRV